MTRESARVQNGARVTPPLLVPDRVRVEHLRTLRTPTPIVQGTRDPFGSREGAAGYRLSPAVRVAWVEDGDHSFTPRKTSGRTEQQNWDAVLGEIVAFLEALPEREENRPVTWSRTANRKTAQPR
jgi:predicted alpha/beta-hydrolase family hydrolase